MARLVVLKTHSDSRGSLTLIEKELPYPVQRAYYIYNVPNDSVRGGHAHKETTQVLICINGSCKVSCESIIDKSKSEFLLNSPDKALILDPPDFHYMSEFSPGSILLVLSSHPYNPDDYIHEIKS